MKGYKEIVKSHVFNHVYLYNEDGSRGGVLLVLFNKKEDNRIESNVGYSICSRVEPGFNKALGKAIAIMRAKSGKTNLDKIPLRFHDQVRAKVPLLYEFPKNGL